MIWRLIRPIIPLILWQRTRNGKELAERRIERYGQTDGNVNRFPQYSGRRIWLHGVSVGEIVAALRLAQALADHLPDHEFLITTNTVSGGMQESSVRRRHHHHMTECAPARPRMQRGPQVCCVACAPSQTPAARQAAHLTQQPTLQHRHEQRPHSTSGPCAVRGAHLGPGVDTHGPGPRRCTPP